MSIRVHHRAVHQAFQNRFGRPIVTIDSHTAGEATRLIIAGIGPIPGQSMAAKRAFFQNNLDHVRMLLTREPRGHRDLLAAAVTEPVTAGANFGLVYMDACRYPQLCGHATIGAVATLLDLGVIDPSDVNVRSWGDELSAVALLVDTPSGPMPVLARTEAGRAASVSFTTVPSFVFAQGIFLDVPRGLFGVERLCIDLVCVGGFFAMVDLSQPGLDLEETSTEKMIWLGMRIIERANMQVRVSHPLRPDVNSVDVVEFYRHTGPGEGYGLVVYGESHLDRSPCGTGTAAKLTLLHHKGLFQPGQEYANMGPLKTIFTARIHETTTVGTFPAVTVQITGSAHITGRHEFVADPQDPFPQGFLL